MLLNIDMTNSLRLSLVPFLLRGFLRLLVLVTPLFVLFSALVADTRRVTWLDPRTGLAAGELPSSMGTPRSGTSVDVEARIHYVIDHASVGMWVLSLLPGLVLALAVSTVALLLLRLMHETYAGRPFSDHGVRRLRLVAAVVGIAAVTVPLLNAVSFHATVARVLPARELSFFEGWDVFGATIPWLVVALLVLAVAEAFSIGAGLADDVDGLV